MGHRDARTAAQPLERAELATNRHPTVGEAGQDRRTSGLAPRGIGRPGMTGVTAAGPFRWPSGAVGRRGVARCDDREGSDVHETSKRLDHHVPGELEGVTDAAARLRPQSGARCRLGEIRSGRQGGATAGRMSFVMWRRLWTGQPAVFGDPMGSVSGREPGPVGARSC
jgi:hypothetical protein